MDPGRHGLPGSFMPNAGLPKRIEGQFVYSADAAWFGEVVPLALAAGARIVGGCCGTTPAHVAAIRSAVDTAIAAGDGSGEHGPHAHDGRVGPRRSGPRGRPRRRDGEPPWSRRRAPPRRMGRRPVPPMSPPRPISSASSGPGNYVISVEIDPPRSIRIERTVDAARLLAAAGTDCVNISDSAMARVRMGALAVAFGIQHDLDLECVVHLTTRDRNLMALESELLGAHALGVRNFLALTGDPPRVGDYPTGTGVWDVDSIGLVRILARLNRGEDEAGAPIGGRAAFTIACALDPTAEDTASEWDRLARKLEAGAQLVMTQPLFDAAQVETMLAEARRRFGPRGFPVPLLLGVLPLQSSRHAEFLHHEVPGITIPDAARAAMRAAGESAAEVGLETALGLLRDVGTEVAGTYVMPSFGRYEQAAELVRRLRAEVAPRCGVASSRRRQPAHRRRILEHRRTLPHRPRRSARLQRMGATDTMELFFEQLNGGSREGAVALMDERIEMRVHVGENARTLRGLDQVGGWFLRADAGLKMIPGAVQDMGNTYQADLLVVRPGVESQHLDAAFRVEAGKITSINLAPRR